MSTPPADPVEPFASLEALARPVERGARFQRAEVLAKGGMGVVHRALDVELHRSLAVKVLSVPATPAHAVAVSRFLEEARITAQLDHPGIVPVHEVGVGPDGHVYFAMKLVSGRDLRAIFDCVQAGREGWSQTRAVGVLLKVCEAMAYAHSKGVIHRDLKPSNVMVGGFGEVFVMDWGLARAMGREEVHDLRLRLPETSASLHTERRETREETPDSPLVTMDGVVVGTPAYMPPEQARGEVQLLSPRSDVYSLGAMLYDLLTGSVPYVPAGARVSKHTVLARVIEGPPTPILRLAPRAPAELVAIAEKAMARAPEQRYPDTRALAEDLRAYLEHRVVHAHQAGAWAELSKWVRRNRALAAALAAALVFLLGGGVTSALLYLDAHANEVRASENEQRAQAEAAAASLRAEQVLRLSAFQRLDDLAREADELWPIAPARDAAYRAWLTRARALVAQIPAHEATLAALEASAARRGTSQPAFASDEDRWWHAQLVKLLAALREFADPEHGLCSRGVAARHGAGIERRLELAEVLAARTLTSPEARSRWAEAAAAVAVSPFYRGLALAPQFGLLPLGPDPASGLWEFVHLESGEPPERDDEGHLVLTSESGLVLVLLPGGETLLGASRQTSERRDPLADGSEHPPHRVRLSPYLVSKYEVTQCQWTRLTGENPSYRQGHPLLPVETVTWFTCREVCRRAGLELPSEAQWEHAARGGTDSAWWMGDEPELLADVANLADRAYKSAGRFARPWEGSAEPWDDGSALSEAVGQRPANPFGLHDVIGNLWEWCLDAHSNALPGRDVPVDPVNLEPADADRVIRGGAFDIPARFSRSAARMMDAPQNTDYNLGLRPVRRLDP